ncbi:MAG: hypothetical protein LBL00_03860, partial [Endomicrobium sp.]|nr:hypothetical protein [Endomicrobium sp.]
IIWYYTTNNIFFAIDYIIDYIISCICRVGNFGEFYNAFKICIMSENLELENAGNVSLQA